MSLGPSVAVINSGGANIASVMFALERIGVRGILTSDALEIKNARRVILPGVGAAKIAMSYLQKQDLIDCIRGLTQPVLGICLGMQLLFEHSEEGNANMLDILPGTVMRFNEAQSGIVPHMGWNNVAFQGNHPLLWDLLEESYFYFVHSYYVPKSDHTLGVCNHGASFSAIVAKDNFMGCQFHPERSGQAGAKILRNFMEIGL